MFILNWILKWIGLASSQMWLLVAGAFGVLVIVARETFNALQRQKMKNKQLENDLSRAERLQNVKVNTTRDAAVERLREHGDIRPD
jgi:biopolymer transport protein ExbB/TolQ